MKNVKTGDIFSETQFYVVKEVKPTGTIVVTNELGEDIGLNENYVKDLLNSADAFDKEEKRTMTELADIFVSNRGIAMTVAFYKKDTQKTPKAYNAEKQSKIDEITNAKVADIPKLLSDLIENPISKVIAGELRVMKGRHYGSMDDLGRIHFVDMELPRGTDAKGGDTRMRQVDPRTIQYVIVDNVKYALK